MNRSKAYLFSELSSLNKPWQGVRIWESIEDDFSISVFCSPLGQVLIEVYLSKSTASPEEPAVNMNSKAVPHWLKTNVRL